MFGTVTPEWLAEINGQKETNIHNINKKFFDRWLERLTALLGIISAIAHFRGKDRFLSFKCLMIYFVYPKSFKRTFQSGF